MIERIDGHLRVTVPMKIEHANGLLEAGRQLFRGEREIIDLAEVREVDSSALAVLLGWLRSAQAGACTLQVINAPAGMRALADLYGIDEILALA
ncbi:MAG TPA: STAS domain-containing protein [Rhodocyclaceae bacterium]|nr:STAS domain-containing protein [Rhodocyclaceae bacterium]